MQKGYFEKEREIIIGQTYDKILILKIIDSQIKSMRYFFNLAKIIVLCNKGVEK